MANPSDGYADEISLPEFREAVVSPALAASLYADAEAFAAPATRQESTAGKVLPGLELFTSTPSEVSDNQPEPTEVSEANDTPEQKIAADAVNAIRSGDTKQLMSIMATAAATFGGDTSKIRALGNELTTQLKDSGFEVKYGSYSGQIAIHKAGAPQGVEFRLSNQKGDAPEFKAQAYDWVTKRDVDTKVDSVISDFKNKTRPGESALKDSKELGKMYDDAARNGKDYSAVYKELSRSASHAYQIGGMEAVRELEKRVNKDIVTGHGPAFLQNGDKLSIHLGTVMPAEDVLKGLKDGSLSKDKSIIEHPVYGHVKTFSQGPEIVLPKR